MRTVTDDDVGAAEELGVVDRDTGRAAVGIGTVDDIGRERKQTDGAREAHVITREGDRALTTAQVRVEFNVARAH